MKFIKYFVVLVLVFTSCKSKKNLIETSNTNTAVESMSAKKIAKMHMSSEFSKTSIDAKLKANFNNGKLKQSISVSLKIKKDEVIWLKGSKFITVFKAKITPTNVRFYSPLNRKYFDGDFSMIKKLLGTDINFKQLQNLLLGQSILDVKAEKQNLEVDGDSFVLSPKKQANLFDIFFTVNSTHFKLDQQSIVNSNKNQRLDVFYPAYNVIDNEYYPSEIKIRAKKPGKFTNIDFSVKSVQFNTDFDTPFAIPNGYKEIKL